MGDSTDRDSKSGSDDSEVDVQHVKELAGFIISAPKRRPRLAVSIFLLAVLGGLIGSLLVPKWWAAEVSILVQKNVPIQGVAGPREPDRADNDPMRGTYEQVLRHDNLVALAHDAHLFELMAKKRSVLGRLKDRFMAPRAVGQGPTPEMEDAIASLLGKNMSVSIEGSTLTIGAEWWDAETAFELVTLAQKKFLDSRYASEVSVISDGIALLEEHAKVERLSVDEALKAFEQAKVEPVRTASTSAPGPDGSAPPTATLRIPSAGPRTKVGPDPELARAVEDKRRQIRELEDDRNRRLAEAKNQLAGLLATYTPAHPAVAAVQGRIDALSAEPGQLTQLKNDERALLAQIAGAAEKGTEGGTSRVVAGGPSVRPSDPNDRLRMMSAENLAVTDPVAGLALKKLQSAIRNYETFMDRIVAANLQLDVAKAAFKYRYAIFKPAEIPQKPKKGNPVLLIVAGVALGLLMAFVGPAIADLASGRFIEVWQVKRRLGLPLLGEVTRP